MSFGHEQVKEMKIQSGPEPAWSAWLAYQEVWSRHWQRYGAQTLNVSALTYRVVHSQEDQQWDGGHPPVDPLL